MTIPRLTSAEKSHITAQGERFDNALARATMKVRSCQKLTGLEKVRASIAMKAALKATGFDVGPFVIPPSAGLVVNDLDIVNDINEVVSSLFDQAVEAATPA